jgi:hypothetical protein
MGGLHSPLRRGSKRLLVHVATSPCRSDERPSAGAEPRGSPSHPGKGRTGGLTRLSRHSPRWMARARAPVALRPAGAGRTVDMGDRLRICRLLGARRGTASATPGGGHHTSSFVRRNLPRSDTARLAARWRRAGLAFAAKGASVRWLRGGGSFGARGVVSKRALTAGCRALRRPAWPPGGRHSIEPRRGASEEPAAGRAPTTDHHHHPQTYSDRNPAGMWLLSQKGLFCE